MQTDRNPEELFNILVELVDELRMARTMAEVNVAAGAAWQDLLGLDLEPAV